MAGEKRQTCWPKLPTETEYESQLTAIRQNKKINKSWWQEKKKQAMDIWPTCQRKRRLPLNKQFKSRWNKGRQERSGD